MSRRKWSRTEKWTAAGVLIAAIGLVAGLFVPGKPTVRQIAKSNVVGSNNVAGNNITGNGNVVGNNNIIVMPGRKSTNSVSITKNISSRAHDSLAVRVDQAKTQPPQPTPQANPATQANSTIGSSSSQPVRNCFDPVQPEDIQWGQHIQVSEEHMGLLYAQRLTVWPEGARRLRFVHVSGAELEYSGPPEEKPDIRPDGNCWTGGGCTGFWVNFEKPTPEMLQLNVYYSTAATPSIECIDKIQNP